MSFLSQPPPALKYQCAVCFAEKRDVNHWWVMWESCGILHLAQWTEELARGNGVVSICGELCAEKAQSMFIEAVTK